MITNAHKERERRLHRDSMDKYVFEPSRDYAAAFGLFGFGIGCLIVSVLMSTMFIPMAVVAILIGFASSFAGIGWMMMIKARLVDYREDIMNAITFDVENTMQHNGTKPPGTKAIPFTENGVTRDLDLPDRNPLTNDEWVKVATAVLHHGIGISEKQMCRDNSIISQRKFADMSEYMTNNKYKQIVKGKNKLTLSGEKYLEWWLSSSPTVA